MCTDETVPTDLRSLISLFEDHFERWLRQRGASGHIGRLLCVLLLADRPLTQSELAERLDISQSTVSKNLKVLSEEWRVVERSRASKGTKEVQYQAGKNSPYDLLLSLIVGFQELINDHRVGMADLQNRLEHLSDDSKQSRAGQKFKQVLEEVEESCEVINNELGSVISSLRLTISQLESQVLS